MPGSIPNPGFLQWLSGKEPTAMQKIKETGSIPGSKDSLEEGMATHSSVPCPENPMDRGDWQAIVHRVTKSWT